MCSQASHSGRTDNACEEHRLRSWFAVCVGEVGGVILTDTSRGPFL